MPIQIIGAMHDRSPDAPVPACPPEDDAAWYALSTLDEIALREMGLRVWCDVGETGWPHDRPLMLFPVEWYEHIPEGYVCVTLTGLGLPFSRERFDNDSRSGCLAFGILAAVTPS